MLNKFAEKGVEFFGYMPKNGIAESYGRFVFSFWSFSVLILELASICIPTNSEWVSSFSTTFPAHFLSSSVHFSHSDKGEIQPQNCFNFIFSITKDNEHFWGYLLIIFISPSENSLIRTQVYLIGPFVALTIFFSSLCILNINPLSAV